MNGLFWNPRRATRIQRALVALFALGAVWVVEAYPAERRQPHYKEKLAAARKASTAFEVLRSERLRRRIPIDPSTDTSQSGMLGSLISSVTSGSGSLESKQTSINPNFAAVVVGWLKELDLERGDRVAIGMSGSFPALNVCVLAAVDTLGLEPVIVSSVAASQWGANVPDWMWLDMEKTLREQGVFKARSSAASRGGVGDRGLGLSKAGRAALETTIERNGIERLEVAGDSQSVELRMQTYLAQGDNFGAYINVGGGTVSVGTKIGKKNFKSGLNQRASRAAMTIPSVIGAFLKRDVPAIHLVGIIGIANKYALPIGPHSEVPTPGTGGIFVKTELRSGLAAICFGLLLVLLFAISRSPWTVRVLQRPVPSQKPDGSPQARNDTESPPQASKPK